MNFYAPHHEYFTGMQISINFLLTYNWTRNNANTHYVANKHYVDFNNHAGQVVLRLQFDAKCKDKDNCTRSQVRS